MYEMFMGPLEQVKPWNTQSVGGVYRFLNRVWNLLIAEDGSVKPSIVPDSRIPYGSLELEKSLHRTIKKVTEDLDSMRFHTAIAALMTFCNEAAESPELPLRCARDFVLILSPYAPHIAEELWQRLGGKNTLAYENWPEFNPDFVRLETVTIAVQISGKLRDTVDAPVEISKDDLLALVKGRPKVQHMLEGKTIVREIVVPGRLVNLVVK